jgi:hypothetical protein
VNAGVERARLCEESARIGDAEGTRALATSLDVSSEQHEQGVGGRSLRGTDVAQRGLDTRK